MFSYKILLAYSWFAVTSLKIAIMASFKKILQEVKGTSVNVFLKVYFETLDIVKVMDTQTLGYFMDTQTLGWWHVPCWRAATKYPPADFLVLYNRTC